MIADLVIILALLIGVYIGISRGFAGPLISEGAFLIALFVVLHLHGLVDGFLPIGIARSGLTVVLVFVLSIALRLLARPLVMVWRTVPLLRAIDAPLGAVAHGLLAFVLLYLALGVVLDFDRNVYPLLRASTATAEQIELRASSTSTTTTSGTRC